MLGPGCECAILRLPTEIIYNIFQYIHDIGTVNSLSRLNNHRLNNILIMSVTCLSGSGSLDRLGSFINLRRLETNLSSLSETRALSRLPNLKRVRLIIHPINEYEFLRQCKQLVYFYLYDNKNVFIGKEIILMTRGQEGHFLRINDTNIYIARYNLKIRVKSTFNLVLDFIRYYTNRVKMHTFSTNSFYVDTNDVNYWSRLYELGVIISASEIDTLIYYDLNRDILRYVMTKVRRVISGHNQHIIIPDEHIPYYHNKSLNVFNVTINVNIAVVDKLFKYYPNLKEITLSLSCSKVDELIEIAKRYPNLEKINVLTKRPLTLPGTFNIIGIGRSG